MKRTETGFEFSRGFLKMLAFVFTIGGGIFSFGVAFGAAHLELAGKADQSELVALRARFVADSIDKSYKRSERNEQFVALNTHVSAIEVQIAALNLRFTQLFCGNNPNKACR